MTTTQTVVYGDQIQDTATLEVTSCCNCGVLFALPKRILDARRQVGGEFYCPNGHNLSYKTTELERLRKEREADQARVTAARDQARAAEERRDAAERSNSALRGQATKLRKRVAAGVCPCCHRTFKQLAAHMENKHPEYTGEDSVS